MTSIDEKSRTVGEHGNTDGATSTDGVVDESIRLIVADDACVEASRSCATIEPCGEDFPALPEGDGWECHLITFGCERSRRVPRGTRIVTPTEVGHGSSRGSLSEPYRSECLVSSGGDHWRIGRRSGVGRSRCDQMRKSPFLIGLIVGRDEELTSRIGGFDPGEIDVAIGACAESRRM